MNLSRKKLRQLSVWLTDFLLERVALFDKIDIISHGNTLATENQ